MASGQIGIVLADDRPLIRSGLRRVLDREDGISVVGEADDVEGALAPTRAHRPRVVMLDLNMPGEPTLPAIPRFIEAAPGSAVPVSTMEAEPGFARQALQAGHAATRSGRTPGPNAGRPPRATARPVARRPQAGR